LVVGIIGAVRHRAVFRLLGRQKSIAAFGVEKNRVVCGSQQAYFPQAKFPGTAICQKSFQSSPVQADIMIRLVPLEDALASAAFIFSRCFQISLASV
jgi:hypothetical protein